MGSNQGVYEIIKGKGTLIFPYHTAVFVMHRSDFDTLRVLMGLYDGFKSIRYENGKWVDEGKTEGINENIRSIKEDKQGNIWLGTVSQGALMLRYDHIEAKILQICRFDTSNGLPEQEIWIEDFNNKICFAVNEYGLYTTKGIEIPSSKSSEEVNSNMSRINSEIKFIPDTAYSELTNRKIYGYAVIEDISGNIWSYRKEEDGRWTTGVLLKNTEGSGKWFSKPFNRITSNSSLLIYPENDKIVWFGGGGQLYRYDGSIKQDLSRNFYALIRMVISGSDSVIFFGTNYDSNNTTAIKQPEMLKPNIIYTNNSITFQYASPYFDNEPVNQFQYYLDGFDHEYSGWSSETKKEYTNLPEGTYYFRVRAKNIYDNISEEAVYEFTILSPWYRTAWAYTVYALLFFVLGYTMIKLNSKRLEAKNLKLQKIIEENTADIRKQKDELADKNEEIIDSINYAKHIQDAILPMDEEIKNKLPDSFILFKPKDIVSGDFYWFTAKKKKIFIAACDCTGHGVPGAFVSMIGNNLLHQTIIEQDYNDPGEILTLLNMSMKQIFTRKGTEQKAQDGMDMALCVLTRQTAPSGQTGMALQFAGANNPFLLIRKGELIHTKGDKNPIGGDTDKFYNFTTLEFNLQKGDTIYIFSDGYQDQFGGQHNKKFMIKRFKELLLSIQNQPMEEQKEQLNKALEEWRGNEDQVDDILVIGIRI